ncbi:hypothetical protein RQP46_003782 [Phenoliferia psychrophenolica]
MGVHLPTETLLQICATVPEGNRVGDRRTRNRTLAALCLVSKAWRGAAHQEMYTHLKICWRSGMVLKLFRTFAGYEALHLLVRTLDAEYTGHQQWLDEFQNTAANEEIYGEASEIYPVEDESLDEKRRKYVEDAGFAARLRSGDEPWLRDGPAHQQGSDVFFYWIQFLQNLRSITLRGFNQNLDTTKFPRLPQDISRLLHIKIKQSVETMGWRENEPDDHNLGGDNDILALASAVETLDLSTTWDGDFPPGPDLVELKRLRLRLRQTEGLGVLTERRATNLVAFDLNIERHGKGPYFETHLLGLFAPLPDFNTLRLRCLRDLIPEVINTLAPISLQHLRLDDWYTTYRNPRASPDLNIPSILKSPRGLPSTLKSLIIDITPPQPLHVHILDAVLAWKDELPQLELLGFVMKHHHWTEEVQGMVRDVLGKAEGFRCVLARTANDPEVRMEGQWWDN